MQQIQLKYDDCNKFNSSKIVQRNNSRSNVIVFYFLVLNAQDGPIEGPTPATATPKPTTLTTDGPTEGPSEGPTPVTLTLKPTTLTTEGPTEGLPPIPNAQDGLTEGPTTEAPTERATPTTKTPTEGATPTTETLTEGATPATLTTETPTQPQPSSSGKSGKFRKEI